MAWDDVLVAHVSKYTAATHNEIINQIKARVLHSLSTAENDVLVGAPGGGSWVKKTLAEFKTILGLGSAAYTASTAYEPANANIQSHISSTSNPHSVTYSQAGAAPTSHAHAESDVTGLVSDLSAKAPVDSPTFTTKITSPIINQQSTIDLESAPLGSELLSSSGWTSTDWTGDWASGFGHNTGNTTDLTNTLAAVVNNLYQISFTVTGRTAGTFMITFGGVTSPSYSATSAWGVKAGTTGTLSFTPGTTFDGTIVISIKQITGTYSPVYVLSDSAGNANLEIRSSLSTLYNVFIGTYAGRYNTTGY